MMRFTDRLDAARQLSKKLEAVSREKPVVLALPRGGVPLGLEIARTYQLPLDVILSKKIGHPLYPEFAIGALAEDGDPLVNSYQKKNLDEEWLTHEIESIRQQIADRRGMYDKVLKKQDLRNRSVILIDDGIATGMTMKAAIESVRKQEAATVTVAVPVIPKDTYHELVKLADRVIAVDVPEVFLGAVGAYYGKFNQVSDREVIRMLKSSTQKS
ncbi:phosphoribosyltransferase [Alkalibacterium sp.]|nr:MAG: phosphoribosyl transferase [Alkalibacterium sp.]